MDIATRLDDMSREELVKLQNMINIRLPNLFSHLDDDVITMILKELSQPADRIAMIRAIHEHKTKDGTHLNITDQLSAQVVCDYAYMGLLDHLFALADKIHYMIPSCFENTKTLVFADWSPFRSRFPLELAAIYWSTEPPHARLDISHAKVKRSVKHALMRGSCMIRLVAHKLAHRHATRDHSTITIRRRGCAGTTTIFCDPVHAREVNVLPNQHWIDPHRCLCRENVRALISVNYDF